MPNIANSTSTQISQVPHLRLKKIITRALSTRQTWRRCCLATRTNGPNPSDAASRLLCGLAAAGDTNPRFSALIRTPPRLRVERKTNRGKARSHHYKFFFQIRILNGEWLLSEMLLAALYSSVGQTSVVAFAEINGRSINSCLKIIHGNF